MAEKFVYSNCIGTFVFDENGKISDKTLFHDVIAANSKLEKSEWLEEEKNAVKKHAGSGKVLFLGSKNEKHENATFTNDIRKLEMAAAQLSQHNQLVMDTALKIAKAKIKESVTEDELIAQAISSVQEIDKAVSMLAKRLREWHGLRNPELSAEISDNARLVEEILRGTGKSEMGADLSEEGIEEIKELAKSITEMLKLRARQEKYVETRMKENCPNILAVAGAPIGAKLLAGAGSLRRLATMPASTLQLLGAEKSMFNFLRKKAKKMPRFGILHEHKFVSSAPERKKGKAARLLADKIAIAARVDYFKGQFIGDKLLNEIEARLK